MAEAEIEFLIIADSVEAVSGKLYMLGGAWDRAFATDYPTQVRMGIAAGIRVPWEKTNEKILVHLTIVDADGQPIGPKEVEVGVEVGRPPGITKGSDQRAILALNTGFPIESPGRYEVRARVGESGSERIVTFEMVAAPKPR